MRLHDQCSCRARHCAGGSTGGIKAAARCGRGRCPGRCWLEHAHWPRSCCHVFKACALCCNASSKWGSLALTDRHRETITAEIAAGWHTQLLPPTPSLPCLFISIFLIPLSSFYPLYFLSLLIFGCGLRVRVI